MAIFVSLLLFSRCRLSSSSWSFDVAMRYCHRLHGLVVVVGVESDSALAWLNRRCHLASCHSCGAGVVGHQRCGSWRRCGTVVVGSEVDSLSHASRFPKAWEVTFRNVPGPGTTHDHDHDNTQPSTTTTHNHGNTRRQHDMTRHGDSDNTTTT
ncbi:hypothetical protein EDB89DRAFT_2057840 [Lactarius sanguifluus]|nr:hypothetical protein EDB89DRAFT_2057840 [Lactarius sanguifluus]